MLACFAIIKAGQKGDKMNKTQKNIFDAGCIVAGIVLGLILIMSYDGKDHFVRFLVIVFPAVLITVLFWYVFKDHKDKP